MTSGNSNLAEQGWVDSRDMGKSFLNCSDTGDSSDDFSALLFEPSSHFCLVFLDNPFPKDKGPPSDAQTGMDKYQ